MEVYIKDISETDRQGLRWATECLALETRYRPPIGRTCLQHQRVSNGGHLKNLRSGKESGA